MLAAACFQAQRRLLRGDGMQIGNTGRPDGFRPLSFEHVGLHAGSRAFANWLTVLAVCLAIILCASVPPVAAQTTQPSTPPPSEPTVQLVQPPGQGQSGPPITVTYQDALERARKNDLQFLNAVSDLNSAHEDRLQARNALL